MCWTTVIRIRLYSFHCSSTALSLQRLAVFDSTIIKYFIEKEKKSEGPLLSNKSWCHQNFWFPNYLEQIVGKGNDNHVSKQAWIRAEKVWWGFCMSAMWFSGWLITIVSPVSKNLLVEFSNKTFFTCFICQKSKQKLSFKPFSAKGISFSDFQTHFQNLAKQGVKWKYVFCVWCYIVYNLFSIGCEYHLKSPKTYRGLSSTDVK